MAPWKAHSLNHSQRTTGRSSVPLEETSSNNGAIPCPRYLREVLTDVQFGCEQGSKTNREIKLPRGGHKLTKKSSKIVPLGAPFSSSLFSTTSVDTLYFVSNSRSWFGS